MASGPIVRLVRDRGFGFVRAEDGSEIFFEHSTLGPGEFDALQEGQQIEFNIENDPAARGQRSRRQQLRRRRGPSPRSRPISPSLQKYVPWMDTGSPR